MKVTWLEIAWASAVALIGAALTYGVFYADRIAEDHQAGESLATTAPEIVLFLLSVALGGMLAGGVRWHGLLRPAGLLAGFIVFGHIVWGVVAIDVSAAFALSNWCEMAIALLLIHAATEAQAPS